MAGLRRGLGVVMAGMLLAPGCASLGDLISPPRVKVESLVPVRVTPEVVEFLAKLAVANDNPITLPLERIDFKAGINDRPLFSGALTSGGSLPAMATQTMEMPFRLNFRDLGAAAAAVSGRSDFTLQLDGQLSVAARWGFPALPFNAAVTLPVPRLPQVSFAGLRVLPGRRLGLALKIANANSFPFTLHALSSRLEINGRDYSLASLSEASEVKPRGEAVVTLELGDSLQKTAAVAASVLAGSRLEVRLQGELEGDTPYGQWAIPFASGGASVRP